MNLPTVQTCRILWAEYRVPENIRRHMNQVDKIAHRLAKSMDVSPRPDIRLVRAGALLHDVLRVIGFGEGTVQLKLFRTPPTYEDLAFYRDLTLRYAGLNHAEAAARLVLESGYDVQLAQVIRAHDYSLILDPVDGPVSWEAKIVYYADKRVMHDQVVSLEERLADARRRYPEFYAAHAAREELMRAAIFELEHELFFHLPFVPEAIVIS